MAKEKENEKKAEYYEIYTLVKTFSQNKKISEESVIKIFEDSFTKVLSKEIDPAIEVKIIFDEWNKSANLVNINGEVVDDYIEDDFLYYMDLETALKIDKNLKLHDTVNIPFTIKQIENSNFGGAFEGKKLLVSIYNAFKQNVSEYKKKKIFSDFNPHIGETFRAKVNDKNKDGSYNLTLYFEEEQVSAYLPVSNISSKKILELGETIDVTLESVNEDSKLSQLCVSVDSPRLLEEALKREIPEIANGLIEIVKIERKPGERSKVAIRKTSLAPEELEPVGTIIGVKGDRINAISAKFNDEKIDVVLHTDDIKKFIISAMNPGKAIAIVPKNNNVNENSFYVIVEEKNLTNAIGKKGINVLLATRLTNAKIDVISEEQAKKKNLVYEKIQLQPKQKTKINNRNRNSNSDYFSNINFDLSDFDHDLETFKEQEQQMIQNTMTNDISIEEMYSSQLNEGVEEKSLKNSETVVEKPKVQVEEKIDYKEVKETIKNFKTDKDLANFGLMDDIDLDDINEEDWN